MAERCAVIGIGQTKHDTARHDLSMAGLVREAAEGALPPKIPFQPPLVAGAGGYFAPTIREYIRRTGAPEHIGIKVAVKDRLAALKNPYAHLHVEGIDDEMVRNSMMLWDPIRYLESCPASDGACAMVLTSERAADSSATPPAWVLGTAVRSEPLGMAGRDEVNPRAGQDCAQHVYRQARVGDPPHHADVVEKYVPFSRYEPVWPQNPRLPPPGGGWENGGPH